MGIETSAEHGGSESSFTAAIIAVEELAKVDPSVSVMCDVHNTLVNTIIRKHGTKEQQDKFMPLLAQSQVRLRLTSFNRTCDFNVNLSSSALSVCPSLPLVPTHLHSKHELKGTETTGSSMAPRCGLQTLTKPTFFSYSPTSVSYSSLSSHTNSEIRSTRAKATKA
jgi:Acyl-CoA dehydrogenase, N-terminal domain